MTTNALLAAIAGILFIATLNINLSLNAIDRELKIMNSRMNAQVGWCVTNYPPLIFWKEENIK